MLTQKQRKAASGPAIDPAEAARLEREEIRQWLETKPGEEWSEDAKRPADELAAEAAARKAAGVRELAEADRVPAAKRLSWNDINQRDYSRLELAQFAAEAKRLEREAKRNAQDTFKLAAVKRSAQVVLADMPAAEVVHKAGRAQKAVQDYSAMAEVAADLGVEVSELAEALAVEKLLVADQTKPLADVRSEVGYAAELTPAEVLERKERAAELLQFAEAVAGREALAAIGPRASALVSSNLYTGGRITVSLVRTVPDIKAAEARIEGLSKPLAEAREALERAEAKVTAAAKLRAKGPLKSAEAEADRIAAGVRKLAARMERAEAARDMALELASMPMAEALVSVRLESFKLAEAAEAGALEIPDRADRMPTGFVERGPRVRTSASWSGETTHGGRGSGISDPTGDSAAALADGYARALAITEARAAKLAAKTSAAALAEAAEVARDNQRAARRASEAARQRALRRARKDKR